VIICIKKVIWCIASDVIARIIRTAGKNSAAAAFVDIYHILEKTIMITDQAITIADQTTDRTRTIVDQTTDLKIIIEIQKEISRIDIDVS